MVVGKSPEGVFKAYAVRCHDESREELLASDSARSEAKALASLLTKSCEAVHQYHAANGFLSPSAARDRFGSEDEDEDDAASDVSGRTETTTAAFSEDNSSDDERPTPATSSLDKESYAGARASRPTVPPYNSNNNSHKSGARKNRKMPINNAIAATAEPLQIPSSTAARNFHGRFPRRNPGDESEGEEGDRGNSIGAHYFHSQNPHQRIPMRFPQEGARFTSAPVSSGTRASLPSIRTPPPPQGWATGPPPPPPISSMRGGATMVPAGPPKPTAATVAAASARNLMTMPSAPPNYHPQQPLAPLNLPVGQHPHQHQHQHQQRVPMTMPNPAHVHQHPNYTHGRGSALPPPPPPPTGIQPPLPTNLTHISSSSSPGGAHSGGANNNNNSSGNNNNNNNNGPGVPPTAALHDVRMTIRWPGRGEQRVLERVRASVGALQEAALSYVRAHPATFGGGTALAVLEQAQATAAGAVGAIAKPFTLHVVVRQALFGADAYDMTTYRSDDLSRLFAAMSATNNTAIPSFDIEVVEQHHLRPGPGPVPAA